MPRLARLRFVNIGHAEARFDDLTLDFLDSDKRASDAVIWLRNAGGKSSILNLFFALMRPGRLNFLGGTGSTGKAARSLRDYVLDGDRAVIAAEWELEDAARGGKLANQGPLLAGMEENFGPEPQLAGPAKYLTGAFHQLSPPGRADAGAVHTLFFAARVIPGEPAFTLDHLPLFIDRPDGRRVRRSLADFKQEWHNLGLAHPIADSREVTRPSEWTAILENAQLDPELFAQQVKMNQREGGADALFQFRDAAEFLDFFLELTLEPEHCERVAGSLEAFRNLLARRATQLLPQRELVRVAREGLEPVLVIHRERAAIRHQVERTATSVSNLTRYCQARRADLSKRADGDKVSLEAAANEAENARTSAASHRRRAAALRYHAEVVRGERFVKAEEVVGGRLVQAKYARALWTAAMPLREFLVHESEASGHLERLNRIRSDASPMLDEVRTAAARFARALGERITFHQDEQRKHRQEESGLRGTAQQHRSDAREAERKAGVHLARADELARRDQEAVAARDRLQHDGASACDELPTAALERWTAERGRLEEEERSAEMETKRLQAELERVEEEARKAVREKLATAADRQTKNDELEAALTERQSLERDPLLARCLDLEAVNLEGVEPAMVYSRLLEVIAAVQTTGIGLRLELAAGQRALDSLEATHLLPPDPDVELLRRALLVAKVRTFSGWEYLAANCPPGEQRQFVLENPEVADGIVVPDDDWLDAAVALAENVSGLDRPVVVVAQGMMEGGATRHEEAAGDERRLVVGPSGDAHFDSAAGEAELAVRRARSDEDQKSLGLNEEELAGLNALANELQAFRKKYPLGWFAERNSAITSLDEQLTAMQRREESLELQRSDLREERRKQEAEAKRCGKDIAAAVLQIQRIEQYFQTHGRDDHARTRERQEHLYAAETAQTEMSTHEEAARGCDAGADALGLLAAGAGKQVQEEKDRLAGLTYLEADDIDHLAGETLSDVEALGSSYRYLVAEYERRIGQDGAQFLYENACQKKQTAWARFDRTVSEAQELDEASVRQALAALPDHVDADRELHQATTEEARLSSEQERNRKSKNDSAGNAARLKNNYSTQHPRTALPKLADLHPTTDLTPERMDDLAEQATRDGDEQDERASSQQNAAQAARARHTEALAGAEKFEGYGKRLDTLQSVHRNILAIHPGRDASSQPVIAPMSASEAEEKVGKLEGELLELAWETDALNQRCQRAVETLRSRISSGGFTEMRLDMVERLNTESPEVLENSATVKCDNLDLWAVQLDAEIASIDTHRARVAGTLRDAALEGLNLLRNAERRSKLPAGLGHLSGEPFLRIRTREPVEHAEQLARMHRVIDDVVVADQPPGGLGLIQRAVHNLVQPVSAQVLFPDPDVPARFVSVETLATQSGGERLTCAILLYCTLARLRNHHRKVGSGSNGGVLVLDNPIGTASRRKFVRMQREAARAMGVQLLYTTAVHDLEALRELPATVRLRNERRDRYTGQRGVELDPRPLTGSRKFEGGSAVSAARLVRSEDRPLPAGQMSDGA